MSKSSIKTLHFKKKYFVTQYIYIIFIKSFKNNININKNKELKKILKPNLFILTLH